MEKLPFDPYALAAPKTPADRLALIGEACRILEDLNESFQGVIDACEQAHAAA